MKKTFLLVTSFALLFTVFCQKDKKPGEAFYMLDANMKSTQQENAVYFIHAVKLYDSCWQFDTYNLYGPIISSEQYLDEKGTQVNGMFCYYNKKGKVDSSGVYLKGFQDGPWYFTNDTGRFCLQKDYIAGKLCAIKNIIKIDSLKHLQKDNASKAASNEVEADFVGGQSRWIYYLGKHMNYPERALKANKQGTVVVQFIIDTEGNVTAPEIAQSVEYSLDQEALRLIKGSPAWIPSTIDGKKVRAYKKQPITFKFEAN